MTAIAVYSVLAVLLLVDVCAVAIAAAAVADHACRPRPRRK